MKKNNIWKIFLILGIFFFIAWVIYSYNKPPNTGESNYNSTHTSFNQLAVDESSNLNNTLNNDLAENISDSSISSKQENSSTESLPNNTSLEKNKSSIPIKHEIEVASFTTKIYTKDSGRQNNVTLACSTLNDAIVENGKTFSFSNTVGKATSKKGYKKADVFKNGDIIEALGGGLCQVSTTLYNAILKVPDTKVLERHSHSNKVPYIKSGKDAAVSYGTYDFRFVNNTGNSLKIKATNTKNNVTVKILKLE